MARPAQGAGGHRFVGACEACGKELVYYRKDPNSSRKTRFHNECRPVYGRPKSETSYTPEESKRRNRSGQLLARYGVTADEWDEVLAFQNGVCAVCGAIPPPSGRNLHSDHDHATGEFRGILCWLCNNVMLRRGVTPERLRAAADYLEKPPALQVVGPRIGKDASARVKRHYEKKFGPQL